MREVVTMSFPASSEYVRVSRKALEVFLQTKGLSEADILMIVLGLNEAVANVIEHTYKYDRSRYLVVTWEWEESESERRIHIMLRDFGPKVDESKLVSRPLDELRESGLGLYLMRKAFDRVEFDKRVENGNLLHLEKRL